MDISKIKIGSTTYDIKDAVARKAVMFRGVTTTAITDDSATPTTITINEESYTPVAGDLVLYGSEEFIYDGAKWHKFGDKADILSGLGALAYKDSVSATVSGTNQASTVTLTGGTTGKLVTTSITGTNGTETVSKVTSETSKLKTASITPVNGTESVSKVTQTASKLVTTSITPVSGTESVSTGVSATTKKLVTTSIPNVTANTSVSIPNVTGK